MRGVTNRHETLAHKKLCNYGLPLFGNLEQPFCCHPWIQLALLREVGIHQYCGQHHHQDNPLGALGLITMPVVYYWTKLILRCPCPCSLGSPQWPSEPSTGERNMLLSCRVRWNTFGCTILLFSDIHLIRTWGINGREGHNSLYVWYLIICVCGTQNFPTLLSPYWPQFDDRSFVIVKS